MFDVWTQLINYILRLVLHPHYEWERWVQPSSPVRDAEYRRDVRPRSASSLLGLPVMGRLLYSSIPTWYSSRRLPRRRQIHH